MTRPRLLDLYCGAGGASEGYSRAGFDVVGVDLFRSPRYRFPFIQADVLKLDMSFLRWFDAIHASPPCQFATPLRHAPHGKAHPNLIPGTRNILEAARRPYVIENVEAARPHLCGPILLCGTMFGLGAQEHELRRHRLFESNVALLPPCGCRHSDGPVIGIYGGHARRRSAKHGGRGTQDVWSGGHRTAAAQAMGMDWASLAEMSEAIPPAYSEHIGRQIAAAVVAANCADMAVMREAAE